MQKIFIFGTGKGEKIVQRSLIQHNVDLIGYMDNDVSGSFYHVDGKRIFRPEEIEDNFNYIIVSVMRYQDINEQLFSMGIDKSKIIDFFSLQDASNEEYWCILDKIEWRIEVLTYEFQTRIHPFMQNAIYELADTRNSQTITYPVIRSASEAVEQICKYHKSLSRFGDGEFELIRMRKRAKFQNANEKLAERLREILCSKEENIIIAIADNYGSLARYTQDASEDIRNYLAHGIRQEHMALLRLDKVYYDAYLSRPYIIYKDKQKAGEEFQKLKKIWENRNVLVVEGDKTRMGVGNDLFEKVCSVKRVLAPCENAFYKYNEILNVVKRTAKDEIILIALGPTATVLAYDLAVAGLWAIDIGHLDLEYEWYCMHAKQRQNISYKYVNEIRMGEQADDLPENLKMKYEQEIICNLLKLRI